MLSQLYSIATIKTGLIVSRKKAETANEVVKSYQLLNLKSINADGSINLKSLDSFDSTEKLNADYLTCEGDIVLRYTEPFTAVYISKQYKNIVIPSHFCIIRLFEKKCNSKYIAHQLNSNFIKNQTQAELQGTIIKNITPSIIGNVKIDLPNINKQNKIAEFLDLINEKKVLQQKLNELIKLKEKHYINLLFKGEIK